MKTLIEKLQNVAQLLAKERGALAFFGLFQSLDSPDYWDLVVSAPWLDNGRLKGMRYLAHKLGESLEAEEMLSLSRIVPIKTSDPSIASLAAEIEKQVPKTLHNFGFAGMPVVVGHVITAASPPH